MKGLVMMAGVALWLLAVFGNWLRYDITGIWWQNVILFAGLQSIATVMMTNSTVRRRR